MDVLFPFGHGLSYTEFMYSDLALDKRTLGDRDTLEVSCKVKNTGTAAGKEVVQLYAAPGKSAVRRAVRELKGFEKIELAPEEEKTVRFVLSERDFAYYETKIHDWFVESGMFGIEIGSSSRDIRLRGFVEIHSERELPVVYSRTSTVADLRKTRKGRAFFAGLTGMNDEESHESNSHLGAGSDRMLNAMMLEMPLGAFVSYGRMTDAQLDEMIAGLNNNS